MKTYWLTLIMGIGDYIYFEKLFLGNANAFTKKLFYVSCSRAKDNLAVYMQTANASIIRKAKELFGENNCFCLDDLVNPNTSRNC